MGGTITWRVQIAGADQGRADLKSLGEAGASAARTTGETWAQAGQQTEAETKRAKVLGDAWAQAASQRRQYDADIRSSGASPATSSYQRDQMQASALASAAQARFSSAAGVRAPSDAKSARDSAAAFAAELTAMERLEARANALRAALSPLVAAQQRYGAAIANAGELLERGAISEAEHATAVGVAKKALQEAEHAAAGAGAGFHLSGMQAMELEHSARAIADSVMAGQNPLRAFALEGGRIAQVFGNGEGGVGAVLAALGRVVFGPIGAVAALTAAFVAAGAAEQSYALAQSQVERYLMGAGREAGVTAAQLQDLVEKSAAAGDVSVSAARGMAVAFLQTGQIAAPVISGLIGLQRDYAAATGQDAKAATEALAKAFADPARGAEELNHSLHFLDDQQLEHIRLLTDSGDRTQAQEQLTRRLGDAVDGAATKFSAFGKIIHTVADSFNDAWTEAGKFFYQLTHVPDLARVNDDLAHLRNASPFDVGAQNQIKELLAERQRLEAKADADYRKQHGGLTAQQDEVSTRAGDAVRALDPTLAERERLRGQLATFQAAQRQNFAGMSAEEAAAAKRQLEALPRQIGSMITAAEREQREASIRAELASRPGSARRGFLQQQLAQLQTAGRNLTPGEAASIEASGRLQGENRGARVDQAAARRGEAEANKAEAAQKASSDTILRSQEAQARAEETIATSKAAEARAALDAAAGDATLTASERRIRMAQAASELALQNAKDDRLRLELQRLEADRRRQLGDVDHQRGWTDPQRAAAKGAINASVDAQAEAAREQDRERRGQADAAASQAEADARLSALKARASNQGLAPDARAAAEQELAQLQLAATEARLDKVVTAAGVDPVTATRARAAQREAQAAEAQLASDTQAREFSMRLLEVGKGLATTQAERSAIEREQLRISQEQRAAATRILIAQLDDAVRLEAMPKGQRDALAGQLTAAQGQLDASERETLRRQQLTPLQRLYDPSQQTSPRDVAEQDLAETSQRLTTAFVGLEQGSTGFGKAIRDVVTSLQSTVLTQVTNRLMAPVDRLLEQGLDKLLPATASTGVTAANTAMAQSAAAATTALTSLSTAAASASTSLSLNGMGGGLGSIFSLGESSDGISFSSLASSGQWADFDALAMAGGGLVRGPGSPTSDGVNARLSAGEYVVNARATSVHRTLLEDLNAGALPRFAGGGYYGDDAERRHRAFAVVQAQLPAAGDAGAAGGGDVHVHNHTGVPMKAQAQKSANGDLLMTFVPEGKKFMRGHVMDPNGFARDMRYLPKTLKTRIR